MKLLNGIHRFERKITSMVAEGMDLDNSKTRLQEMLDKLCLFITNGNNAAVWEKWESRRELIRAAADLRESSSAALSLLEYAKAEGILNNETDFSEYEGLLSASVREEVRLLSIDERAKVVFIGSGPLPLSPLTIAKVSGAEVLAVDRDPLAVRLGREVADKSGLSGRILFAGTVAEEPFLRTATHILIASMVKEKRGLLAQCAKYANEDVKYAVRYGNGLKSVFNYPLDDRLLQARPFETVVFDGPTRLYDIALLQPRLWTAGSGERGYE